MVVAASSAAFLAMLAATAPADVFNLPAGQTSLQFVTVGDAGNGADTTGYGSVPYVYQMGTYDVTIGQYIQFLNAVAKTDTYGLYNSGMLSGAGWFPFGIVQNGGPGSYRYAVAGSYGQAVNCPVFFVTWGDAARFCNWLQNGQPTGAEGQGTTETGAYTLNGDTTFLMETRNATSTFVIPSENEWYKAAYYKGKGVSAGYWTYPTQSNTAPSNALSGTGTNNANFPNPGYTDPTNYLTPVGAFAASPGPYGTYDQGGDVYQWSDTLVHGSNPVERVVRGGSWANGTLASSFRGTVATTYTYADMGFRVAVVPESGDANLDGRVDINDLTIVLTNFGKTTGMNWETGDFNGDGTVDINDLTIVLASFGESTGSSIGGSSALPEPGAVALLLAGACCLPATAWRRRRFAVG
jgi:formylglycine-generating enzyme required for sulfatase activity